VGKSCSYYGLEYECSAGAMEKGEVRLAGILRCSLAGSRISPVPKLLFYL
jgi:hypothetical protein